jgi:hypothetical protein
MFCKLIRSAAWLFLAALAAGCDARTSPPAPADPATARAALRAALDAWQKGATADSLKDRRPPVYVIDPEWRSGRRLLAYQVQDDAPFGADLRCRVVLSLADDGGRPIPRAAVYAVGTSPALTVAREEDP